MRIINNKNIYIIVVVTGVAIIIIVLLINFLKEDKYDYIENFDNDKFIIEEYTEEKIENITDEDNKIKIHILGAVNYNGIIELESGSRISDAIEIAGGLTEIADVSKVNLAYVLEDGEKLYIPTIHDENDIEYLISERGVNEKVNINTAKIDELQNIPGVGPSIAQAIIDYRDENGKFKSIEDIKSVSGVGESKYKKMEKYIKVK